MIGQISDLIVQIYYTIPMGKPMLFCNNVSTLNMYVSDRPIFNPYFEHCYLHTMGKTAEGGDTLSQQYIVSQLLIIEDKRQLFYNSQFGKMLLVPRITNDGMFQLPTHQIVTQVNIHMLY